MPTAKTQTSISNRTVCSGSPLIAVSCTLSNTTCQPMQAAETQNPNNLVKIIMDGKKHMYLSIWCSHLVLLRTWDQCRRSKTFFFFFFFFFFPISEFLLMLSTLGKFSADILKYFLIFPRKQNLTFHANSLQWRQFALNVKFWFLRKIRKHHQFVICWISQDPS